jgi:hypothetical protein
LKINFNKSEVSFFSKAVEKKDVYAHLFTCKVGKFPFKYLGVTMHVKKKLIVIGRRPMIKSRKKTACWKGCLNSIGGRLILIESSLSKVPSYMLSLFRVPKGVLKRCDVF